MNFQEQKNKAMEIARLAGIPKHKYANPAFRTLWKMGVEVPPPHFASVFQIMLIFAIFLSPLLGIWIYMKIAITVYQAIFWGIISGIASGGFAAFLYKNEKAKHKLPNWDDIRLS